MSYNNIRYKGRWWLTALSLAIFLFSFTTAEAQKKEMAQARSYIKSGKNLDKAEQMLTALLEKDSANRMNPKIHALLYQAVQRQYDMGNEKLYLGQKYDTTALFNLTRRMFFICQRLDSLDARPDQKGRVRPEYRQKHAEALHEIRRNLYLGGRFFLSHNRPDEAFPFFDCYLDCARQPLFTDYHYSERDTLMKEAAYWATYTGFRESLPVHTLKYADCALQDTAKLSFTLQYMAEAYNQLHDDNGYRNTLSDGFHRFPEHAYFYPRLLDFYNARGQYDEALQLTDSALTVNPHSEIFLFGKSTVLLNMGRNEESLEVSRQLIGINNTLAEPYFNAGTAILNLIQTLSQDTPRATLNAKRKTYYQLARPYMEHYRKLAPQQQHKWAPALYTIYLNLNMGRQFEEIDRLLKN